MFKAIVICSLVVLANAGLLPSYEAHSYDEHAPAHYDFSYSVHDSHTGDVKEQQESRRGDAVQGSYSLVEPDGHKRTVHYADDGHSGFNAVVQREGTVHPQPVVHAAPVALAHAAPVAVSHAAPLAVAHAAPVAVAHAAPVAVAHQAPIVQSYHAAPSVALSHQSISAPVVAHQTTAHAAPIVQSYQAAPLALAHSPAVALSHQSISAPVAVAHQAVAHAPLVQSYQAVQPVSQHVGYATQGYAGHGSGYSTVSQVTHHVHGAYHH